MALIVITIIDTDQGPQLGLVSEPRMDMGPDVLLSPAQQTALTMLDALNPKAAEERKSRIQLLTPDQVEDFKH